MLEHDKKMKAIWNLVIVVVVILVIVLFLIYGLISPFQNKQVFDQLSGAPSGLLSKKRAKEVAAGISFLNNKQSKINLNERIPSPAMLYNTVPGLGSTVKNNKEKIEWGDQNYPVDEDLFGDNKLNWQY